MKKFILLITLSLINCKDTKTEIKNHLISQKINGIVKTITKYEYDAIEKFGEVEKSTLRNEMITHYNKQGNITKEIRYSGIRKYKYNKIEKLIEVKEYNSGRYNSKDTYEYDKKGDLILENNYYGPNEIFSYRYIYKRDENGYLKKESTYNSDGSLSSYRVYNNDLDGNATQVMKYDSLSVFKGRVTYTYDENNNETEIAEYHSDNTLSGNYNFEYNEHNNAVKDRAYAPDYDIRTLSYYKYIYDKNNNWTKLIQYKDNKANKIIERVIEYYESIN